jgi:hypothetical protein
MTIRNSKEILKELNKGMKIIRYAVNLAKKSMIIGEVNFKADPKPVRTRKGKATTKSDWPLKDQQTKDLPDADEKGYMLQRGKE